MSDPADQTRLALGFIAGLIGGRSQEGRARQAFRTVGHMKSLYLLMVRYIREKEDIQRAGGGVYSPGLRDDAQDARNALIAFIRETPGKEAFLALLEISRTRASKYNSPATIFEMSGLAVASSSSSISVPKPIGIFRMVVARVASRY